MALQTKTYTKGSTAWGSELNAYRLDLTITEESVNQVSNTSLISYKFQITSGSNAFSTWTTTRKLILNGITIENTTSQLSVAKNSTLVYFEGSTEVQHNADGKLDMSIVASIDMTDDTSELIPGDVTFNETMTLTAIEVYTKCTAPSSFSASPEVAEDSINLTWSGASGGTNNAITGYEIQYALSDNSTTFSDWTYDSLESVAYPTRSPVDDPISFERGKYVQYRIRTRGSAGSDYYSNWKYSNVVRRNPYTACSAPTSFTVSPAVFENGIDFKWSGAGSGENNDIVGYTIECTSSKNNSTWSNWVPVWAYTNEASVSLTVDWLEEYGIDVTRGNYFKFRIRTRGSAGSDYYSDWKSSDVVQRNPYTACSAPTSVVLSPSLYEESLTITWSGEKAGTNNPIAGYALRLRVKQPDSNAWGSWFDSELSTSGSQSRPQVGRGGYVQYNVKALGTAGSEYDSGWAESNVVQKNSLPKMPTTAMMNKTEYSPGDSVTVFWNGAEDADGNIAGYRIWYCVTEKDAEPETWTQLGEVNTAAGSGNFTFIPDMAQYHQVLNIAIQTVDALGATSQRKVIGSILRNDAPKVGIHIGDDSILHTPNIYSGGAFGKYMPYIHDGAGWSRYTQ